MLSPALGPSRHLARPMTRSHALDTLARYCLAMNDLARWVGLDGYTPEQWSAFGTMLTAVVAIAAAGVAWAQVSHARRIRDEQAQPNVVIDFEESALRTHLDLVIKNIGQTVAY